MLFDDRLATVLRHRASDGRAARTQFRQLLDLLGARRGGHERSLLSSAWLRLGALGESIPASERAAMIRDTGWRFRNPELAAHLAEDEPEVAAAALARADLAEDDWEALIPRLPIRARGFLRLRRGLPPGALELLDRLGIHDRGLPDPGSAAVQSASEHAPDREPLELTVPANDHDDGEIEEESAISALVKRIEAFQRARAESASADTSPRLPLGEQDETACPPLIGFAFTTDSEGRINWAEPQVAPMVVGALLTTDGIRAALRAWQRVERAPVELHGAPAIAGEWIVDAAPRFTVPGGRFYGLAGKFRRPPSRPVAEASPATDAEADRLRQLLHELRTPVNAIQGFAEVIQQQVFGPVPHEYRALAANIAADSARMLAGFDELDQLARLETGAVEPLEGDCDFALLCRGLVKQLEGVLAPRMAGFEIDVPTSPLVVPIALREGEALAWRLFATLATSLGAGETVELAMRAEDGMMHLTATLPAALATEEDVFTAAPRAQPGGLSAGMFGAGFALRLVRAEARATGGGLEHVDEHLRLTLPLLTAARVDPSPEATRQEWRRPQAR